MNCSHNHANQLPNDVKSGDRFTRLPYCTLRQVHVYDRAWTYCRNFTHKLVDKEAPTGPIFANGLWGPGYVRIPWHNLIEPSLRQIDSCAICGHDAEQGVSIVLTDYTVHEFCSNEHYQEWIENNPHQSALSKDQETFLEIIKEGHASSVREYIDAKTEINFVDDYGRTPLHWSVISSRHDISDILLNSGANANSIDRNKWSPLHYAAFFGDQDTVSSLIKAGADPLLIDRIQMRPIDISGSEGHSEIVSTLLDASYGAEPEKEAALLNAAQQGNLSLVEALVNAGIDIECEDEAGWTPLLKAIYEGHITVSIFLLDQGANVNAQNKYGYTPYSITNTWKTSGMDELKEIVIAHGGKDADD